jgi:hypothetical protein
MKNVESLYNYLIYSVHIKQFLISCVYCAMQTDFHINQNEIICQFNYL